MREEEGEDIYCFRVEVCFTKVSMADLGKQLVSDASEFSPDESDGESEQEQLEMLSRGKIRLHKPVNTA